ncbi:RNA recognition motif 2-domain-containing protein [Dipodascopsis uninucleata]
MYESGLDIPFYCSNEGELSICFYRASIKKVRAILERFLPKFGAVQALKLDGEYGVVCEFFDVRDSTKALVTMNNKLIDDVYFMVSYKEATSMKPMGSPVNSESPPSSRQSSYGMVKSETHREGLSAHAPVFESKRCSLSLLPTGTICERSLRLHESYSEPQSPADPNSGSKNYYYDDNIDDLRAPGSVALTRHESYDYARSKNSLDNYSQLDYFGSINKPARRFSSSIPRNPRPDAFWDAEASLTFQVENCPDVMSRNYSVYTSATVPKNNVVDLERIARGLDTRTTLMLRNIPNKVDQQMLKEYIDVTNKNTYDFLYLRIDFLNKCNVGYAFISFTSPDAIVTFAKARAGTKWNRFNSEKICDISYANIQGKECLIEKFRNSSVMDQDAAYRPKIYYSDGPLKGQEEEFPPPNNMNRKLRSLASIQQIGMMRTTAAIHY